MNRLFNTNYNHRSLDIFLLLLRISIAALMLTHGLPKLDTLLEGGLIKFADPIGIGAPASLALAVFAEVICSIFLILGLGTRLAVIPMIVTMLVAIFIVHGNDPLEAKEMAFHFLLVFIFILVAGAGSLSIDKLISRKSIRSRRGY